MTRRSLPLSVLDLLFILLLTLLVITMLRQPIRNSDIETPAEFIVELTWPEDARSDLDLWFRAPGGEKLYFGSKQKSVYSLDRDDLGISNDTVLQPDGTRKTVRLNREVVTLRGWVAGNYTFNAHSYKWADSEPFEAVVRFIRINPYKLELEQHLTFSMRGQELTAATITLSEDGRVIGVSDEPVTLTR